MPKTANYIFWGLHCALITSSLGLGIKDSLDEINFIALHETEGGQGRNTAYL
ncbi:MULTISPECIES: hypothetical protein [Calothrix]|uniref:Uncharacterized protein n=2 Tax=Calothrix TaxID=1186 RepID=A0ABR8A5F6_9CYAN|nr:MULTISPECIES: hypothetical protein [Calothrix]MBD2194573.1 hypothetical protein [Calothrix parietina FACHB-288]MBD2223321.1 hypothetical protein [Calothrix anomala FACHB-343]